MVEEPQSSEDEEPLKGTAIPQDAFEKAVDTIRRVLGFEIPEPLPKRGRVSRLSLNVEQKPPRKEIPVDVECLERFQDVASKQKWLAYQSSTARTFRVEKKEWKELSNTGDAGNCKRKS